MTALPEARRRRTGPAGEPGSQTQTSLLATAFFAGVVVTALLILLVSI